MPSMKEKMINRREARYRNRKGGIFSKPKSPKVSQGTQSAAPKKYDGVGNVWHLKGGGVAVGSNIFSKPKQTMAQPKQRPQEFKAKGKVPKLQTTQPKTPVVTSITPKNIRTTNNAGPAATISVKPPRPNAASTKTSSLIGGAAAVGAGAVAAGALMKKAKSNLAKPVGKVTPLDPGKGLGNSARKLRNHGEIAPYKGDLAKSNKGSLEVKDPGTPKVRGFKYTANQLKMLKTDPMELSDLAKPKGDIKPDTKMAARGHSISTQISQGAFSDRRGKAPKPASTLPKIFEPPRRSVTEINKTTPKPGVITKGAIAIIPKSKTQVPTVKAYGTPGHPDTPKVSKTPKTTPTKASSARSVVTQSGKVPKATFAKLGKFGALGALGVVGGAAAARAEPGKSKIQQKRDMTEAVKQGSGILAGASALAKAAPLIGKALPALHLATSGLAIGEAVRQRIKLSQVKKEAMAEKIASKAKYGNIAKATATRKARAKKKK